MKGLLKKDLLLLKSQSKYILMIIVICLMVVFANPSFAYVSSYLTFMGTGLVFNSFSYDMYHNEMTYLFALPISKKDYCLEKYIYAFTVTLISWIIALFLTFFSQNKFPIETVITQLTTLLTAFLYLSIMIPALMKYGREKTTMIILMLALIIFLTVVNGASSIGILINQITPYILIGIYVVIVFITLIISYRSTIHILNNKEL